MGGEAVLTNAALLSLWSFWTWLSQEPRDTCRHKKIPPRTWDPGPSSPLPAAPSETTHLESQGGPDLLWDRDKKEKSAPGLGPHYLKEPPGGFRQDCQIQQIQIQGAQEV